MTEFLSVMSIQATKPICRAWQFKEQEEEMTPPFFKPKS